MPLFTQRREGRAAAVVAIAKARMLALNKAAGLAAQGRETPRSLGCVGINRCTRAPARWMEQAVTRRGQTK